MTARPSRWIRLITAITVCAGTTIPGAWVDRAEAQEGAKLLPTPESVLGFRPAAGRLEPDLGIPGGPRGSQRSGTRGHDRPQHTRSPDAAFDDHKPGEPGSPG